MNPGDIRYFIEPGRMPAQSSRVRRWLRAVRGWGRSMVLFGIGVYAGIVIMLYLHP